MLEMLRALVENPQLPNSEQVSIEMATVSNTSAFRFMPLRSRSRTPGKMPFALNPKKKSNFKISMSDREVLS